MVGRRDDTTGESQAAGLPHPGGPVARLAIRSGGQTLRTVTVAGELRIGRDHDNDLVIKEGQVGERHARIDARDGGLVLRSLGTSVTLVNGITLIGHRVLRDGDRIRVGDTLLIYQAPLLTESDTAEEDDEALLAALRSTPPPSTTSPTAGAGRRLRLPWQAKAPRPRDGRQRTPSVMPTPAGLLVLVAVAAIVAYLVAPDSFEPRRTDRVRTPVIAASAPGPVLSSRAQPTAGSSAPARTASGIPTPDELGTFLQEATTLTLRSDLDAAIERYRSLAEQVPRDARVQAGWAWALFLDGDLEQALVHAQEATTIDPDNAQAWTALARVYVGQGNANDALSAGRKAVDLAIGAGDAAGEEVAARAHAVLAEAYLLGALLPQALEQADAAMSRSPLLADALSVRGRLYLLDGDSTAAVNTLRRAAEVEPELWVRHQELGSVLLDLGQYRAAIESLTQAMVLYRKPATYTALGRAHYYLGEYDQAKSYLEQSLSFGTDDVETYALLAVMNAEQGRCDDARVYYHQALEHDAAYPLALQAQEVCERGAIAAQVGATDTSTPGPSSTPGAATSTPPGSEAVPPAVTAPPALPGRIAFSTWNVELGHYDTYVARTDGSDRRLVAAQMHQPSFRPDGQWLALNGERPLHMNIHIVNVDGGDPIEISTYLEDRLPCWSPEGDALIYSSTRNPDRQPRLYIADQVLFDGSRTQDRPVRADIYEVLGDHPAWLPDGRIVYTGCDWSSGSAQCGLLAVSSAPGAQTLEALTDYPGDTAAVAGPDGQIAFMSDRNGNWDIYLLGAGGEVQQLTTHGAIDGLPAWSPNGRYLAFVSNRGGVWAVWAMRPDGSGQRQLFDLGDGGLAVDWQYETISWGR